MSPTKLQLYPAIRSFIAVVSCINQPTKISNWMPIAAYTNPEVSYNHGLGEIPIKVDVQVRVKDTTQNKDIIFNAINSGHRGNEDASEYGGVIYVYNENEVKMFAPGDTTGSGNGKLVHLGGSKYEGPTVTGDFSSGDVRVRLWKQCDFARPTFVSELVTLTNTEADAFQEVFHSVGRKPDLVIVQIFLDNNWVTDAQGKITYFLYCQAKFTQKGRTDARCVLETKIYNMPSESHFGHKQANSFGGVVFAFGKYSIRIWTPRKGSGSVSNGVIFNAIDGWGNDGQFMYDDSAAVRVWAWDFGNLENDPSKIVSYLRNMPADGTVTQSVDIIDDGFLTVKVQVDFGVNEGYDFYTTGTAPTTDSLGPSVFYAGVVYGVMENTIMMWHPTETEAQGCLAMVYGQWGDGSVEQCVKESDAQIVIQLAYADVDEPPCEEKDCNPSDIGPMCVCAGSGYEGQYCDSLVQCSPPAGQVNAYYTPSQLKYDFNTSITFACNNGYEYGSGDQTAICNASKVWEGTPYQCNPKSCGQPEDGINCTKTVEGVTFSDKVTYECADKYDIESGDEIRTCQANQQWSGQAPVCARSCGDPSENSTTVVRTNEGLTIGVIATFDCISGYEPESGNFSRQCELDARWSGVVPVCERVQCGIPQTANGTNSQLSYNSTDFESSATYTCDVGYHSGNKTSFQTTCQASRNWTAIDSCQKVICPSYPMGVKADITSHQGMEYGNVIEYKCQHGTLLSSGTLRRSCQSNTSWSGESPVCEDIVCPDPGEVANGTIYHLNTNYNGVVIVGCDPGFAVEFGDASRTCGDTGQWSGTKPHCGEVYQVFLNPVNGTPPYLPFLGLGGSPNNNPLVTIDDIQQLRIPLKSTDRYKRTLYSVPDDRWLSKLIGYSWILLVSLPLVFCVAVDTLDYVMRKSATPRTNKVSGSGSGSGSGKGNGSGSGSGNSGPKAKNTAPKRNNTPKSNMTDEHDECPI
ncbi:uncharacterized protein LOC132545317 [Ylistrum balloti]|uniref:uncharacterized protein LOC132545317 n=1 Tax=Ylistrum balloti TaxID=509963 RepID=UPI002905DE27|nr:uncharacterized protein LOC132545317 [Ylistrum balloti]